MLPVSDPYEDLYPFQQDAVEFLLERGSGFIWDDPGLGKTRQAIVAAKRLGDVPILVVCPNSLKHWWRQEILNLYPSASTVVAGVGGRFGPRNLHALPFTKPYPVWWIVHYTGVRLNDALRKIRWSTIILDECHYIKNRKAERTKAVFEVARKYTYRIGLTATPFGNNPADLWSQLRWMAPHLPGLRSYWRFFNTFVDYKWEVRGRQRFRQISGGRNLDLLARVMAGYGLRRSKKNVAPHLPSITDTRVPLEMGGKQAAVYTQLRNKANIEIGFPADADGPAYRLVIRNALARLIRMEQWLSHPWKYQSGVKGTKLEWLLEWVDGYDQQAVIATRFKETANHIVEVLKEQVWAQGAMTRNGVKPQSGANMARRAVTGDVPVKSRQKIVADWKAGRQQFLVGTIDTIGTGLNLENAETMVMFDVLWSSIKMSQARERIHRITSKYPVQILYPYVIGTTNEIMLQAFGKNWRQIEIVRRFIQHIQGVSDEK